MNTYFEFAQFLKPFIENGGMYSLMTPDSDIHFTKEEVWDMFIKERGEGLITLHSALMDANVTIETLRQKIKELQDANH